MTDTDILVADFRFLGFLYPVTDLAINAFGVVPGAADVSFFRAGRDGESSCGLGGEGDVWFRFQLPGTPEEGVFALNIGYVPEPGGLLGLASGVLGLIGLDRRRRDKRVR